jgi:lycopene cyclase domain-containing protein
VVTTVVRRPQPLTLEADVPERFQYLALMLACLALTLPLELVLGARVWRRPARTARAIAPTFAIFVAWDVWASERGTWGFSERYTLGVRLPGGMVVEELVFFLVVPLCALLTFDAVRAMLRRRAPGGVEAARVPAGLS